MTSKNTMPGPSAPAFRFATLAAVCAGLWFTPASAQAQQQQQQAQPSFQPPPSVRPTPSQLELSKLLWSTVAAVDHANQSGNYSVLRDISAQNFQINFNPARLTEIFSGLRNLNMDLSNALLVPPTYYEAPQMISNDVFRVRGVFQLRPISIGFDVYYQWEQGRWKLFGIDLQPQQMVEAQPVR
ncbi:hypothetical protein NAP1_02170 [Erythrobacter sp. NAP1]|uniref:hypothetical protein n=1 Tax=Erythrobacter sp. NAP1 TaxID=237727 RepID=UPI0000686975|nr:hypothetical protein [Erythrobacter sp. NAP1]EAQ29540.1 hypothetical protein NAP1_02170 [Erythrobacter sp. NAP1]